MARKQTSIRPFSGSGDRRSLREAGLLNGATLR